MTDEHFDGNLRSDVIRLLNRRTALAAGAGLLLAGCDVWPFSRAEANVTGRGPDGATCIKLPAETAGPFPADGTNRISGSTVNVLDKLGVIREDFRQSFDGLTEVADGVPLTLTLKLVDVANACSPLADHLIYLWSCDAPGRYSLYERASANYLRGAVVTDASGLARLITIFPGCYAGRRPHIHFEVFTSRDRAASGGDSLLTSQLAFEKQTCERVYTGHPAYDGSAANLARLSLQPDMIFASNTAEQLIAQTVLATGSTAEGLAASVTIGIVPA